MENKKLKMADEIYRILSLDFKDELEYKVEIKDLKKMSSVQKWFIYDKYAKRDADVVMKGNKLLADVLGWDVKLLDGIFPVRQIIRTLLKTIGQELDVDTILDVKNDIYDIIDGKALTQRLHDAGEAHVKSWHRLFKEQLEKLCKNVHTIGNYMPCPDNTFNTFKGFNLWHYNDRLDLLYSDILERQCKKRNGDHLLTKDQQREWKEWFGENQERLFLGEVLDKETRSHLGKFRLKHKTFSDNELKTLPEYLKKVNILIEHRTQKIKNICYEAIQNAYFECYKNTLSEFEHGKVFMQICSFGKGYIWVAPEYEKQFESGELVKLFNLEIGKYYNQKPIDKVVGEASWANLFEYAYLSLFDCYIDYGLSVQNNWSLDDLKERAAYFAFKEFDLVKDYFRRYYDEDALDE